jgi:hypothetical protein
VGAAVYKHYLARSNERLRTAATNLAPKASGNAVAAAVLRHHLHLDPDETAHLRPDGQAVVKTRDDATLSPRRPRSARPAAGRAGPIAAAVLGGHATLRQASLGHAAAEHPAADPAQDDSGTAGLRPAADLAEAADLH